MFSTVDFKPLFNHPWYFFSKKSIVLLPLHYLSDFVSLESDDFYGDLGNNDGRLYSSYKIWEDILKKGMFEPLYISIMTHSTYGCDTGTYMKLDSGYNRIKHAMLNNLTHLPVVGMIRSYTKNEQFNDEVVKKVVDRAAINKFLVDMCGRDTSRYDPFPNPIDLKIIFEDDQIYFLNEVKYKHKNDGLVYF